MTPGIKKSNSVEVQLVLLNNFLETSDFRRQKTTQISFLAAHNDAHLAVPQYGMDFNTSEGLRSHAEVHLRLSQTLHQARVLQAGCRCKLWPLRLLRG